MTRFQSYLPCSRLQLYIRQFVISETSEERIYKILPSTSLVMGFQYRGKLTYLDKTSEFPLASAGITGLQNTFRVFRNSPAIGSVLVMFTETGAASFFKEPVHELFDASLSLDHFMSRSVLALIEEQLSEATADQERIRLVENFLLSRLTAPKSDPLVTSAVQLIDRSEGTIRMTALMNELCISQSPLEKRFRQLVGTSPKKFASIVRMRHALQLLSSNQSFTEIGLAAGYYDQAHFGKDVKTFTGLTPTEFIQGSVAY